MKRLSVLLTLALVLSFLPASGITAGMTSSYGNIPLYFIRNHGQVDERVVYYEKGAGHATYFAKDGVWLSLVRKEGEAKEDPARHQSPGAKSFKSESIKLSFVNANETPEIIALDEQAGKVNYFVGNDQSKWRTNIPTYSSVLYKDVYKGVDMKFYGNNKTLEYDIMVKPGADPSVVRFAYDGIEGLKVTDNGDMEITLRHGKIIQKKPYVYQEIDGKRMEVAGSFVVSPVPSPQSPVPNPQSPAPNSYSFEVASYDATRELVIDPVVAYSTYLGGSSNDQALAIAVDSSGNAYVTGVTSFSDFPIANPVDGTWNGNYDAFVTKLDVSGSALVYSTFLGGTGYDVGGDIAVDSSGSAYVTGYTDSSDFPTANPLDGTWNGSYDAFVTKLNASGSALVYSTFLGGTGSDYGQAIAVDSSGNAYVTGETQFSDFPTANPLDGTWNGSWDAFVSKLNASGSALVYSTFLGGTGSDGAYAVAVDSSGNAYVTGLTDSSDFPIANPLDGTWNGFNDAFVSKLNAAGSALVYSTFLGGSSNDHAIAIAVDSSGNAYVTGVTDSSVFPLASATQTSNAGGHDAFVSEIDSAGTALVYSTYLGGSGTDYGVEIAVDSSNEAYVTGDTNSMDFPLASPLQGTLGGSFDAFVSKMSESGSTLLYSTYLGGSGDETSYALAVSASGNAWHIVGATLSTDFPLASAMQGANAGTYDAFVTKITNAAPGLSYSNEVGFTADGVDPDTGTATTTFTYKVVYSDSDNDPPSFIVVTIDSLNNVMSLDATATATLRDGDYTNAEQYVYTTTLSPGVHSYVFTAWDGPDSTSLPLIGEFTGPTVSDLAITTTSLADGAVGVAYSQTLTATGGVPPYTWFAPGQGPPGLWVNGSTGEISGIPTLAGLYAFTIEVTDASGVKAQKGLSINVILDSTPPTGSVVINNDDLYTTSSSVTLNLTCSDAESGCLEMTFYVPFSWLPWEPFATTKAWTLPSGEGVMVVYAKLRDRAGNMTGSLIDYITVDPTGPTGSVLINGGATWTNSTAVNLTPSCTDATSGCAQMRFSNDNASWSSWTAYGASMAWVFASGDGAKIVYAEFKDNAGNASSTSYTDGIFLDATVPTGSVIIDNGAALTGSIAVTLTNACSDATSGCADMRFSNDGASWSTWEAYATTKAWTLSSGDGAKTVYAEFRDNAGNASATYTDAIALDSGVPTGSVLIDGGAATTNSTAVTLTLACADAGSGCADMRFSNDGESWSTWQTYATTKAWTLSAGNGAKTVYAEFRDNAGNQSSIYRDGIIFFFKHIVVNDEPWIMSVAWHDPEMSGDFVSWINIDDTDLPITGDIRTDNKHSGALVIEHDMSVEWDFDGTAFYVGVAKDRAHASGTMTNIYGNWGEWTAVKQDVVNKTDRRPRLRRSPGAELGVKR